MPSRDWKKLLESAPKTGFKGILIRCVAQGVFGRSKPPSYLFTSGKPARCNPKGTYCLPAPQPFITFSGKLEVKEIVDLAEPAIQSHFGFGRDDFFKSYRLKSLLTPLQCLGLEISKQMSVAGMRFPSAACHEAGTAGHNFVLYKNSFALPDSLEILGERRTILAKWP
jgi:hypothetical protein